MWYFAKLITVSTYIDVLSWDLDTMILTLMSLTFNLHDYNSATFIQSISYGTRQNLIRFTCSGRIVFRHGLPHTPWHDELQCYGGIYIIPLLFQNGVFHSNIVNTPPVRFFCQLFQTCTDCPASSLVCNRHGDRPCWIFTRSFPACNILTISLAVRAILRINFCSSL